MKPYFVSGLRDAVLFKQELSFMYDNLSRHFSPYMLGRKASGELVLHGLQHGGQTSKGPLKAPEWKFFDVSKIESYNKSANGDSDGFVKADLKKTEGPYQPPKFITEVIALHPKE